MNALYRDLEGKKVLLTGATRGIGKTIAEQLCQQHAHVIFTFRGEPSQGAQLKAHFESMGGKATGLNFDVTDYEKMQETIKDFIANQGPIEALVNNVGISKDQLALMVKEQDIDNLLNTNLKACMMLTNALYKNFIKVEGASIVNMTSVVGMMGNSSQTTYAATKAGVIGYTKSLAKELARKGVRVNAVAPGFIGTEMTESLSQKAQENYLANIPMEKFGERSDVANLVNFLLSSASKYITGEVIKVDGGIYI